MSGFIGLFSNILYLGIIFGMLFAVIYFAVYLAVKRVLAESKK